ncbi:MAG: sigma-70 family RNA polymerase sigma factor [Fimbriimonadaceae bacterium]|nr:sigma-70 family RNA polymerase sigma factor [Chthonomonadaceae bacterium]MCO5297370.1 sigma-70 family RNA polymerase sigma factor [Fimbriimonadaceae bacterium]
MPTPDAIRFESLLAPVFDTAYRVAFRMTRNADDAADLVQESVLRAYRGLHTFEEGSNFRAWFLRILTNTYIRLSGRKRVENEAASFDESPELLLFAEYQKAEEAGPDPAQSLFDKIDTQHVLDALDSLPPEFAEATTLALIDDLSYQEIAEVLECPIGTVRSRIHRGRALLQRRLAQTLGVPSSLLPLPSAEPTP